jgi:hypothetical protein
MSTTSIPRAARVLVSSSLVLAACNGGETPGGAASAAAEAQAPAAAPAPPEELLLAGASAAVPEWAEDNLRRKDPRVDQWPSEVLHDKAKKVLASFLKLVSGEEAWDEAKLGALLAPSFRGATELRPAERGLVFDDASARVWKPAGEPSRSVRAPAKLRSTLGDLLAPFDGQRCKTFFKIVRVHLEGEERFSTRALVHLDGASQSGLLEQNMDWELDWTVLPGEEVRIEEIRLEHHDEVWVPRPLFAEVESFVLGENRAFQEELMVGVGEYAGRTDRVLGAPYLGMQGIAVGDLDGDGLEDVYVAQHAGLPNRVFLHRPDGTAVDATQSSHAGILENTRGVLIADWDGDGDQDLLLAIGPGVLTARNDGHGVFGDFQLYRASSPGDIYSLSAADPDLDGDLDVYACRYAANGILFSIPTPYHDANNGNPNVYFRNDGERFTDATEEVGFGHGNTRFSLASVWEDFDRDGDLDLFVANDFGRDNLYRNEGGRFTDVAGEVGADDISAGMGATVADYDLDGDADLYVTNMFSSAGQRIVPQAQFMGGENPEVHRHYDRHARGNTLLRNRGDGTFEDATDAAGVAVGGWGWGSMFVDFNNDGLEDLFAPDGFLTNKGAEDL